MIKPNNYEEVKVFEAYEALEVGGHECTIVQMQEVQSQNGKPMLAILLDTAKSDKQPSYYKEKYDSDDRPNKKWGCVQRIMLDGSEFGTRALKNFVQSVCEANNISEDKVDWENICKQFKDKKVCAVFREEEYQKQDGTIGVSIKPYTFRAIADYKAGKIQVPKRKEIQKNSVDDMAPVYGDTMPF